MPKSGERLRKVSIRWQKNGELAMLLRVIYRSADQSDSSEL